MRETWYAEQPDTKARDFDIGFARDYRRKAGAQCSGSFLWERERNERIDFWNRVDYIYLWC
jgi:hypothetical protein